MNIVGMLCKRFYNVAAGAEKDTETAGDTKILVTDEVVPYRMNGTPWRRYLNSSQSRSPFLQPEQPAGRSRVQTRNGWRCGVSERPLD